jgi:hypothetical protein
MENTLQLSIKKYLDDEMSIEEKSMFEKEIKAKPDLKKALVLFALNGGNPPLLTNEKVIIEQLSIQFENSKPLKKPMITWRYHWRNFWYGAWYNSVGLGMTMVLLLGTLWWVFQPKAPISSILGTYYQEASCNTVASIELSKQTIFENSSTIYCGKSPNEQALLDFDKRCNTTFCMSRYYLAHWQLKNGNYPEAVKSFEQCLKFYDSEIANYPATQGSKGRITFNLLLAQLGNGKSAVEIVPILDAFIHAENPHSTLGKSAIDLRKKLEGYLR